MAVSGKRGSRDDEPDATAERSQLPAPPPLPPHPSRPSVTQTQALYVTNGQQCYQAYYPTDQPRPTDTEPRS